MTLATVPHVVRVTCADTSYDHAVSDAGMAAWIAEGGLFAWGGGKRFWPAPLCAVPAPLCPRYLRILEARQAMRTVEARMGAARHRRPGWWPRLLTSVGSHPPAATSGRRAGFESPAVPAPRSAVSSADAATPTGAGQSGHAAGPDYPG
jgi:hypothetical protein